MAEEATRCGMNYVNQRWLGGTLANFTTIRKSLARLRDLEEMNGGERQAHVTKKEIARLEKERARLEKTLSGLKTMESLPQALFIVDPGCEKNAVAEANKLGIPVIAIVDTNCSPDGISYVIPGNDDSMRAIELYAAGIAAAVIEGRATLPEVPVGEDEFVELDEAGKPRPKGGPKRRAVAPVRTSATRTVSLTGAMTVLQPTPECPRPPSPKHARNSSGKTSSPTITPCTKCSRSRIPCRFGGKPGRIAIGDILRRMAEGSQSQGGAR